MMVIDFCVEQWREVQRKANLSYNCHCDRIFSSRLIHLLYSRTYMLYSDYAAHLSITLTARWRGKVRPFLREHFALVFHHHHFLDHNSLTVPKAHFYLTC